MISLFWFTTFTMFLRFYDLSEVHIWNNIKAGKKALFGLYVSGQRTIVQPRRHHQIFDTIIVVTKRILIVCKRIDTSKCFLITATKAVNIVTRLPGVSCELWVRGVTSTDWITTLAAQSLFSFNPTLSVEGKSWLSFIHPRVRIPILMLPVCWSAKAMARRIVVSRCILLGGSWLP